MQSCPEPSYFFTEIREDVSAANKIYSWFPFLKREYSLLKLLPSDPSVLDIGCGEGQYLSRVKLIRPDAKLMGLDSSDNLIFIKKEEMRFINWDLDSGPIPLGNDSFDFINCVQVAEHLDNYFLVFKEVHRLLKNGGLAYIETPDVRSILIPRGPLCKSGHINFYDEPTHRRPFTREALRRLGTMAGFNKISTFQARNWAWFISSPYLFIRFVITRNANYLYSCISPIFGLDVGCVLEK